MESKLLLLSEPAASLVLNKPVTQYIIETVVDLP